MIRVLQIVGSLERTGPSGQMALLTGRLPAAGFDVHVFSLAGPGPLASQLSQRGVHIINPPARRHAGLQTLTQLRQAILRISPHLIHTWPTPNPWTGNALADPRIQRNKTAKKFETPTHGQAMQSPPPNLGQMKKAGKRTEQASRRSEANAWTGNASGLSAGANFWGAAAAAQVGVRRVVVSERLGFRSSGWPRWLMDRLLIRWARRCVVNSPLVRDDCLRAGWPAERLCVIPNGVEPNSHDRSRSRGQILEEFSLPADVKLIGAVGPLESRKRIKDLIWSGDQLNLVRDDCYLLVMGEGPHRWRLQRYRDQVVLRDRVFFLGSRPDASELIAGLDCLWLASAEESVPNCVLEAMTAGVPVVASDIAAHRALITPGETGLLVPLGSRPGYARKTLMLLADEDLRDRCAQHARQHVEQHYSVDAMTQRFVELYRSLIDA